MGNVRENFIFGKMANNSEFLNKMLIVFENKMQPFLRTSSSSKDQALPLIQNTVPPKPLDYPLYLTIPYLYC